MLNAIDKILPTSHCHFSRLNPLITRHLWRAITNLPRHSMAITEKVGVGYLLHYQGTDSAYIGKLGTTPQHLIQVDNSGFHTSSQRHGGIMYGIYGSGHMFASSDVVNHIASSWWGRGGDFVLQTWKDNVSVGRERFFGKRVSVRKVFISNDW
ncbi:hypothetical protein CDAR_540071 [Caerostris darwini]|uniref:Uncharacterized protein n=1 Tax=Caerostris darwini TaxID=1538125 RepID=A0AAV4THD1_9ARAC|nr:hypothetical protein CDAR_540071 [Caerostris darwini]